MKDVEIGEIDSKTADERNDPLEFFFSKGIQAANTEQSVKLLCLALHFEHDQFQIPHSAANYSPPC